MSNPLQQSGRAGATLVTIRVSLFALFALSMASPARADRIIAGSLLYPGGAAPLEITLLGEGFAFDGRANRLSGIFRPWMQCLVPECRPGGSVDLHAHFEGLDLPGTVMLGSQTFLNVGSLASPSSLVGTWTGMLPIPPGFESGALSAPFTFTGLFSYVGSPGVFERLDLLGGGTATAVFAQQPAFPGALALESIRYDFETLASPTPEPASMLLLGSGCAALLAARRLRRAGAKRSNDLDA